MVLRAEAAGLVCLALLLAVPVPNALARARWPARSPRAGLVVWQAVGLGGGLSVLGAGLTLAAGSLSDHWLRGLSAIPGGWTRLGALGWAGVVLTLAVGIWLATVAVASTTRVVAARRAHRRKLDAVAEPVAAEVVARRGEVVRYGAGRSVALGTVVGSPLLFSEGVRLVDHPHAVAYCLPGIRPRVVVSRGALQALDDDEVTAALAHERAHARGHHDLVVQPFVAWRETFPFLRAASRSVAAVELLVELLADDVARRTSRPEDLVSALRRLSGVHLALVGDCGPALGTQLAVRRRRLAAPSRPLPVILSVLAYLGALALVLVPPIVLLVS